MAVTRWAATAGADRNCIVVLLIPRRQLPDHFESGVVKTTAEAWEPYLVPTSPTYVARYTTTIEEAIKTISDAGGVTVVAHPWGRKTHISEERFAQLSAVGLAGIEVDHQEHDPAARDACELSPETSTLSSPGPRTTMVNAK